jgi:cell division protein FtsB
MSKPHVGFQVREHRPWRLWLGIALVALLLVVAFLLGRAYQSYELEELRLVRDAMEARIAELEQRNGSLVKKNAKLEGISKIEHDAYQKSKNSLVQLQQEMVKLKEEIVFYQGIVSPEQLALGINIQAFELEQKGDRRFRYKLVLSKRGKGGKSIKGDFEFLLRGTLDGEETSFGLEKLKQDYQESDVVFSFRYFQPFAGELLLPEQFKAQEIQLKVNSKTRKIKDFSETISWDQALAGGE